MSKVPAPRALRPRMLLPGDGEACARMMRMITPLAPEVDRVLPQLIDRLIDEERLIGGVIEDYAKGVRRVVATTFSGFVPRDFYERYAAEPWPCLTNSLLVRCLANPAAVFLDRAGQAAGNLGAGLDLVMLDYIQEPMDFTSPQGREIMTVFFPFFLSIHRGYNLNSMLVEAAIAYDAMALGAGFRLLKRLDAEKDASPVPVPAEAVRERAAYILTRAMMSDMPPSTPVAAAFTYLPPRFRFTAAEQRLLVRAIEGLTDEEVAAALDISRDAVKQTWRSIYDHVIDSMPDLVTREGGGGEGARGQEKRRRIVSYVHDNAQELRPHYLRH